jgi:GT2 family glycosyltransferase
MRACRGDLIAFVDADDIWEPDKLAVQMDALGRFPQAGTVISDEYLFDEAVFCSSGMSKASFHDALDTESACMAKPVSWLLKESFVSTSSVLVRSEVAARAGFFHEGLQIGEDRDYWLRLALLADLLYVPRTLVGKRENHGLNLSSISQLKWARGLLQVLSRHDNSATREKIRQEGENPDQLFGENYLRFTEIFWYADALKEARQAFRLSQANGVANPARLRLSLAMPDGLILLLKHLKSRLPRAAGEG